MSSESLTGTPLELEHLVPKARGGQTVEENLWLACRLCNASKSDRIEVIDPLTEELVPIYDPRRQCWIDHFEWTEGGLMIAGTTAIGRATTHALKLNRPTLVLARQTWVRHQLHPP